MTQIDDLAERLGVTATALDPLTACSEDEVGRLIGIIDDALSAAGQEVEDGLERTLAAVPRPLRSRARGLLFPQERS